MGLDRYAKAVKYLKEHPNQIKNAWRSPQNHPAGCLFEICSRDGEPGDNINGETVGCLTQVAGGLYLAITAALTKEIRADSRIPKCPDDITVDELEVFAEWQRNIRKRFAKRKKVKK